MRLQRVTVTVADVGAAARWYRDVLALPVREDGTDAAVVTVGTGEVVLRPGPSHAGVHHLAFGIAPADFAVARRWLRERVEPFAPDGDEVVVGPDGWDSRSLYFLGPEDVVLELIARDAHAALPGSGTDAPVLRSLSEVGVGVPDVPAAVAALADGLGLPAYPPQEQRFAPVGDADGLLILVEQDRVWFPTDGLRVARGPLEVVLAGPRPASLALTGLASVVALPD